MNRKAVTLAAALREFNYPMSASRAAKALIEKGILIKLLRPNMKKGGGMISFKILSHNGLEFGRNDPGKTASTTPMFYPSTFQKLIDEHLKEFI